MQNNIVEHNYEADQIQVLEGLEPVRVRPGMYIGSTDERGLHHLVFEILDNSIDEAMAGHCDKISVTILSDGGIRISDNGRGVPVDIHPTKNKSALEIVHTVLHAGGKFNNGGYKVSGGLHGVGASVVNALSKYMKVTVTKNGNVYEQDYERGVPLRDVSIIGSADRSVHGTTTIFYPDAEIFETVEFNYDHLKQRIRELAFLNKGIFIAMSDERTGESHEFNFTGGLKEFIAYLNNI